MRHFKLKFIGAVVLAVLCGFFIVAGCVTSHRTPTAAPPPPATTGLKPSLTDGRIAYWTARLLDQFHYLQEPLDKELSKKFFDGYVQSLDPRRENFLQSDLDEFSHFRTNLDTYTIGRHGAADLTPAFVIYQRFVERFEQHVAYVDELLKQDRFKFTGDDRILLDRSHAPYPKDLDEARQLWKQHLRYEYLQEKLSREISPTNDNVVLALPKSATEEISNTLAKHYNWQLHTITNWDSDNVLQIYLEALAHAYDPHSDYLNNEHAQDFSIGMSLSLFGIGAQLGEDDGYCTIAALVRGGPAFKSKQLKERDRIIAVAQSNQPPVNVVDMDLPRVVQMIRGPKGTEVRLTISPAEDRAARRVVTLIRDEIKLEDQEAKAELIETPNGHGGTNRIGVLDLPSFYATVDLPGNAGHTERSTTADAARLIKKLEQEKINGLVIDLRNNPGGSLEEAIKFTGLFIKGGPVVLARNSDGQISVDSDTDSGTLYSGPLVVLVNRFSASASEIVAAALQDYGRAVIVGDTSTFGKGTVQNLDPLRPFVLSATNDPGTLKITIRKFYRVSGGSTQWKGVVPDIILPDTLSYNNNVESERTLDNSLPYDTIPSVSYEKMNEVKPYLAELRLRSEERVATNQDFIYMRQDIAELEKQEADKTATLNEREALKERQTIAAQNRARDAERAARKAPDEVTYDITVENAGEPGLPTNSLASSAGSSSDAAMTQTNSLSQTGTNAAPAVAAQKPAPPPVDPLLTESENILDDYILLMSKTNVLIANQPAK